MVTRRTLLLSGIGITVGGVLLKPSDNGGAHNEYFSSLNTTLHENGIDTPVLVIDLDKLDRNIDRVVKSVTTGSGKTYRVVAKSIPSPELVNYVAKRANTNSIMVFHRPFLQALTRINPKFDILMGKPMPIAAATKFHSEHEGKFDPSKQLQWLIDTPDRLNQYLKMAQDRDMKIRVNLEIDVGLHRGGFEAGESLTKALSIIEKNSKHLEFSGFMGYDAHLMGIPQFLVSGEMPKVRKRYRDCVTQLNNSFPSLVNSDLCFNGAGSPTFRHYEDDSLVNDLSAGSCLMKPTHYDLPILEDFEEASYIASPVLKRLEGARLPALEWTGPLLRNWDQNQQQTFFCYSGNWMAVNESPPGLTPHFAYKSSNQQGYSGSNSVQLDVDDFIFLRPTQSEAVLLQFGDLVMIRGNELVNRWPVIPAEV